MAFHLTSEDIFIEEGHFLVGRLCNDGGEYVESRLDLDSCLGNDGGRFQWDGEGTYLFASCILTTHSSQPRPSPLHTHRHA